ncbi:hypothetical protein F5144DRAFT_572066 [Chaetomium tenue]|uniref:Uncharacterized protein n=1 Tax=Chaetomium tenue TaxID=1854479 RepID=A0ACB7PA85_9PEZI|nr:hypothetical protein F5144DRAFT_572066 [Chaetomium globosum]
MFTRQIQLRQSITRQCCCHRDSIAWISTRSNKKKSKSRSSSRSSSKSSSSSSSTSSSDGPQPSLYYKLFGPRPLNPKLRPPPPLPRPPRPDYKKPSRPIQPKEDTQVQAEDDRRIDVSHVADELRAWLKDAGASAAAQVAREEPEPEPKPEPPSGKPVLVLSSMSRSLVASDFYRWAPQGRHVAGWAGGISKVVQSISPVTREPRGQYFLFFDTWDAAYRCRDQFTKAYQLTNKNESPDQPKAPPALKAQTKLTKASAGDNLPFSTTPMELRAEPRIIPTTALLSLINSEPVAPHHGLPTHGSAVPYRLAMHLAHAGNAPKHDLSWSVLVRLTGGKITVDGMIQAIATDGAARNLPWRLIEPRPDVESWPRPVQSLRSGSGRIGPQEFSRMRTGPVEYGYTRFVVTFVDAAEGRRFARAWHRREMVDEWTQGVIAVNTTPLW